MGIDSKSEALIKSYFKTKPVLKAYLFGSYVRGEAQEGSDVDLLVELDRSVHIGLQFIQMKIDLEKILHAKVDLVTTEGISKYMKPLIEKERQLIYAR